MKFFFLQGKASKEIHAILTETLACFLPCRAKDLSGLWRIVTEVFDICDNMKYVHLFNSVLFLETEVYMVGYNMLTLQSPGILRPVHL